MTAGRPPLGRPRTVEPGTRRQLNVTVPIEIADAFDAEVTRTGERRWEAMVRLLRRALRLPKRSDPECQTH